MKSCLISVVAVCVGALLLGPGGAAGNKKLEKVSDDEILNLIQNEKHVVALFSKEIIS